MAFLFPCFRDLKKRLGQFDAVCECAELAIRDFVGRAVAANSIEEFVGELSSRHNVRVNSVDVASLQQHVVHLYLVSVHQSLEEFLNSLKKEHPQGASWNMDGNDDRLSKFARAAGLKQTLAFDVCQHYRDVRNAFVHPAAKAALSGGNDCANLRARVQSEKGLAALSAPNSFHKITFDDFVLYTRCVKTAAEELCVAARPSDEDLARMADDYVLTNGLAGRLRKNPTRLERAKSGYLQTQYSLSSEEAVSIITAVR